MRCLSKFFISTSIYLFESIGSFSTDFLDSSEIVINHLIPNKAYDVFCFAQSDYGIINHVVGKGPNAVDTLKPVFHIDRLQIKSKKITFFIHNNLPFSPICVLFNDQCMIYIFKILFYYYLCVKFSFIYICIIV